MSPRSSRICVNVVTHVLNPTVRGMFERLRREAPADHDVRLILSADDPGGAGEEDEILRVRRDDLFRLGYPEKCRDQDWQMAGNLDLVFLEAARRLPPYEQYWFVEYDVHWEGRWGVFFEHFRASDAAVLAATLQRIEEVPRKEHIFLQSCATVPDGMAWDRAHVVKAFLPICRISRAALALLDAAYRQGLGGHYEFNVATVAAQNGLPLEDFGGDGAFVRPENVNRFYFARGASYTHSPGNFVFRPAQKVLPRPNTLWHPVKPDGVPLWHPLRVGGNPVKSAWEWFKPFIGRGVIRLWFATRWRPLRDDLASR